MLCWLIFLALLRDRVLRWTRESHGYNVGNLFTVWNTGYK